MFVSRTMLGLMIRCGDVTTVSASHQVSTILNRVCLIHCKQNNSNYNNKNNYSNHNHRHYHRDHRNKNLNLTNCNNKSRASLSSSSVDSCPLNGQQNSIQLESVLFQNEPLTTEISGCPFHNLKNKTQHNNVSPMKQTTNKTNCLPFEQIPTPKGLPLIGTLLDLIKAGGAEYMHQYCDKQHKSLGSIYREKLGNVEAVFISDAKLVQKIYKHEGKYPQHMVPEPWIIYNQSKGIRRGLFFMEGEEWSNRRKALNKVFLNPNIIKDYHGVFNQVVSDILNQWTDKMMQQQSKKTLLIDNLEKVLYNWSIESLGTMIFGRRLGCVEAPKSNTNLPDIHEFVHCVQKIFVESANMQLIPPKLAHYLKLPVWKRFEQAAGKALDLAFQYVNENAKQSQVIEQGQHNQTTNGIIKQMMSNSDMKLEEISRIIVDLFIAAADTTSHATQWALYLLSRHSEVQEKLFNEINQITGGQPISEEHLPQLSYVRGIIKESLRLYPVAPFLTRYLSDDLELGGYNVPKGQLVVISLFTTGRKDEYFQDSPQFLPERWIRDENGRNQVNDSFACLPFGLGVRSCIGRRVAEVQMQLFISRIVQQFRIKPTSDEKIDIKLRMITTPEKSIDLLLEHRDKMF